MENSTIAAFWERRHSSKGYKHEELCDEILNFIEKLKPKSVILDHGCGGGRVCEKMIKKGCFVCINDISESAIKNTKELNKNGSKNIIYSYLGQISNWDGPLNFDGVVSHRVLHALKEKDRKITFDFFNKNCKSIFISARHVNCDVKKKMESAGCPMLENNSYYKPGKKFIHFFTEEELKKELYSFDIIESGIIKEDGGGRKKENTYCYAIGVKK